jgi:predicted phosphodiesterase
MARAPLKTCLLAALSLVGVPAVATAQPADAAPDSADSGAPGPVRFFFVTDVHSNFRNLAEIVADARLAEPAFVLDGGDLVHDGTETEFRLVDAELERLDVPWFGVRGNHDAELRGPLSSPVLVPPPLRVLDLPGIALFLLDNQDGSINEDLFEELETALAARAGERIVVAMHVPAIVGRLAPIVRLRGVLPFRLADPSMPDPAQVERFVGLMERFGVLAVLTGHTHYPSYTTRGGVRYLVGGAAGGLLPGPGISHQYLVVHIVGDDLEVVPVRVGSAPPRTPIGLVIRVFRFYTRLNGVNHAVQGWNYVPSVSVQLQGGARRMVRADEERVLGSGVAAFERSMGVDGRAAFLADLDLAAGRRDLLGGVMLGVKLRAVGDYNRNAYLLGGATAGAGVFASSFTASVGTRVGTGLEWRAFTAQITYGLTTGHRATTVTLGRRY